MSARQRIDPGWTWDDDFNMSQAIQIGNAIYVSGQVSMDSAGTVVGAGDMKSQTRQALQNVKTILESAGASMDDVVKITVYMTDISALAFPGLLIEIEAIAVKS